MAVITTHDVTLRGQAGGYELVLRPLCDDHLPLLCRWNADPEVLYWTETGEDIVRSYNEETVRSIYGGVSRSAHCFLVEANGRAVGECWLQRMNLPDVRALYPGLDVRRIDMTIGEKEYWGRGIGTGFIGLLVAFAFGREHVDVLHSVVGDYNLRSQRAFLKNGFRLVRADDLPPGYKGKQDLHFALTRREYESRA